ncbi:hypothetical protein C7475_103508 [Chitinophaga sp. S165]|nr:hypothetical protein C7475_103508 [Chitinophaga sp. S165]
MYSPMDRLLWQQAGAAIDMLENTGQTDLFFYI